MYPGNQYDCCIVEVYGHWNTVDWICDIPKWQAIGFIIGNVDLLGRPRFAYQGLLFYKLGTTGKALSTNLPAMMMLNRHRMRMLTYKLAHNSAGNLPSYLHLNMISFGYSLAIMSPFLRYSNSTLLVQTLSIRTQNKHDLTIAHLNFSPKPLLTIPSLQTLQCNLVYFTTLQFICT